MKDFQDNPEIKATDYGLFLIKQADSLTGELIGKLMKSLKGYICSLELIQKGDSVALVGFFPHFIASQFPSLEMIEIEDYILGRGANQPDPFILSRQISLDDSFAWKLIPQKKTEPRLEKNNFKIELDSDQYLAWQVVFEGGDDKIQITPRIILKEQSPHQKIDLIKRVKPQIEQKTSLTSGQSLLHSGIYEDYKKRTLIPKQVQSFLVRPEDIKDFLS